MDFFSIIALVCTGIICLAIGILIGINIGIDRYWEIAHNLKEKSK